MREIGMRYSWLFFAAFWVMAGCSAPVESSDQALEGCMDPGVYEVRIEGGPAELTHPDVEVGEEGLIPYLGRDEHCYSYTMRRLDGCRLVQRRLCPTFDHRTDLPVWDAEITATHRDRAEGTLEYEVNFAERDSEGTYSVEMVPVAD